MRNLFIGLLLFASALIPAQAQEASNNAAGNLLEQLEEQRIVIGGYGQIDYNQPLDQDIRQNGKLDVHRLVILFGYSFSPKTSMVTEIEYEHVTEVYIEQAFIQHRLAPGVVWKADMQWSKPQNQDNANKRFNMGIGFWF